MPLWKKKRKSAGQVILCKVLNADSLLPQKEEEK